MSSAPRVHRSDQELPRRLPSRTRRTRSKRLTALVATTLAGLAASTLGGTMPAVAAAGPAPAPVDRTVIGDVHTDAISTFVEDGRLVLDTKADMPTLATRYANERVWFHVDDDAKYPGGGPAGGTPNPAWPGGSLSFVAPAGSTVWMAPQSQQANVIWPGFSTEAVPGGWLKDNDITFTLDEVTGPGDVELWTTGSFGASTRLWSSDEAITTFTRKNNVHMHANWGFTEPGLYELTVTARGVLAATDQVTSDTGVYTFVVGELPEQVLTTTTLEASATEVAVGDPVTLSSAVSPAAVEDIDGAVEFRNGTTVLGHEPLDENGEAALTVPDLAVGTHDITAHFVPETSNLAVASTSDAVRVQVADGSGQPFSVRGVADGYVPGDTLDAHVSGVTLGENQTLRWLMRPVGTTGTGNNLQTGTSTTLARALSIADDGYEISVALRSVSPAAVLSQTPWVPVHVTGDGDAPTLTRASPELVYAGDRSSFTVGGRALASGETARLVRRGASGGLWATASTAVFDGASVSNTETFESSFLYALQVVRDGVAIAQSEPVAQRVARRETQIQGMKGVYRLGDRIEVTGTVFPPKETLSYRWVVQEAGGVNSHTVDLPAGTAPEDIKLTYTPTMQDRYLLLYVLDGPVSAGYTYTDITMSDLPPGEQIFAFNGLAGHYHQGDSINLRLSADPALAEGDTIAWQWRFPGEGSEWLEFPGAHGLRHEVTAEQALDGVEVRATLDFADGDKESLVAGPTTIHNDDHGGAARQKPTVAGPTEYTEGESLALVMELPANGRTVLTDHRWERRAAGSEEWTLVEGENGDELDLRATIDDDGAAYRVSILKPGGVLAYGPSPATQISVAEETSTDFGIAGIEETYAPGETLRARVVARDLSEGEEVQWLVRPSGTTYSGTDLGRFVPATNTPEAAAGRLSMVLDPSFDGYELKAVILRDGAQVVATQWAGPLAVTQAVEPVDLSFHGPTPFRVGDTATLKVGGRALAADESIRLVQQPTIPIYNLWVEATSGYPAIDEDSFAFEPSSQTLFPMAVQVVRDGLVVAQSEPIEIAHEKYEVLFEGMAPVYRAGQSFTASMTPSPDAGDRVRYSWAMYDDYENPIKVANGEAGRSFEMPVTAAMDGKRMFIQARMTYESGADALIGGFYPYLTVTDQQGQLFLFSNLSDHYHQGYPVDLQLTVDPGLTEGDSITWEWRWPGADWESLPGAKGLRHELIAEQAMDGLEVRATLTAEDPDVDPVVAGPVTIRVDDHGAPANQQPSVTGPTAYTEGESLALSLQLPADGATVLTDRRWERKAAGAEDWTVLEGQNGNELALGAALADDGASYRVSILKPTGEVAYGPSEPLTVGVVEETATELAIAGVENSYEVGEVLRARVVGRELTEGQTWRWIIRPVDATSSGYVFYGDGANPEAAAGRLRQALDTSHDGYEIRARLRQGSTYVAGADTPWVPIVVADQVPETRITFPEGQHHRGDDVSVPLQGRTELAEGESLRLVYRFGGPWYPQAGPDFADGRFDWRLNGSPAEYAIQTLRDGVVVAMSDPFTPQLAPREVQVEGVQGVYRVGATAKLAGDVFPQREGLVYRWYTSEITGPPWQITTTVLQEGSDPEDLDLELPMSMDWHGKRLYFAAVIPDGKGGEFSTGSWSTVFKVSDADPSQQLFFLNDLSGHYHQGYDVNLNLIADPALDEGDTVTWQWLWPGGEWVSFPGASGMSHQLVAEQALAGVQVRALLDYGDSEETLTSEPVTIHHDDHGAAARQKPSVGGSTSYTEGEPRALEVVLPENGATVLTDHRWERRAAGSDAWEVVDGASGRRLNGPAPLTDDGASYRVSILKPTGGVAYGPSEPVTLAVSPDPTPDPGPDPDPLPEPAVPDTEPVPEDELTPASAGGVELVEEGPAEPGAEVSASVGVGRAGDFVSVWLHSDPVWLGWVKVDQQGRVKVALPADASAGAHKLVIKFRDGALLGWTGLTVRAVEAPDPVATTLTAQDVRQVFGQPVSVEVSVSPRATGAVSAVVAGQRVTAPLSADGQDSTAELVLPAGVLEPGSHEIEIAYDGVEDEFLPSATTAVVEVVRAPAELGVQTARRVERGGTLMLNLALEVVGVEPSGVVKVRFLGKVRRAVVEDSAATVKVRVPSRTRKTGERTVVVTYLGDDHTSRVREKVRVRVAR